MRGQNLQASRLTTKVKEPQRIVHTEEVKTPSSTAGLDMTLRFVRGAVHLDRGRGGPAGEPA